MTQAVPAGWHKDPWMQAPLRWWDGTQWTGHTSDALPSPSDGGVLSSLVPPGGRIAVFDVETTGLYASDRIVEIGVVTLDAWGAVVDRFETLVNPNRDVGPVWLHGITPSMVANAPSFEDIVADVGVRLDGAIVCAHNLPFDARMLTAELARCSVEVEWGSGLDTLRVTGSKLAVACAEVGIDLSNAHCALSDAEATSRLLLAYAGSFNAATLPARLGPINVGSGRLLARSGFPSLAAEAPFIAALMASAHAEPDVAAYMHLLDVALADLRLTADERRELALLAGELGLDNRQVGRAHRDLIGQMVDAAVADSIVTATEYEQLVRAAALLQVDVDVVDRRTAGLRSTVDVITVDQGMAVCFTGSATDAWGDEIHRSELERLASEAGFIPIDSVTASGCDLLVAADPASLSGKAAKARKFGIPIAGISDFLDSLGTDGLVVTRFKSAGIALVCTKCGDSWLASRRSGKPVCEACKVAARSQAGRRTPVVSTADSPVAVSPALSSLQPAVATRSEPDTEILICVACGGSWRRGRLRGRKPKRCPACV